MSFAADSSRQTLLTECCFADRSVVLRFLVVLLLVLDPIDPPACLLNAPLEQGQLLLMEVILDLRDLRRDAWGYNKLELDKSLLNLLGRLFFRHLRLFADFAYATGFNSLSLLVSNAPVDKKLF